VEGKLFFSAEMLSQVSVSPGLMRQLAMLDFRVMQGEMNQVTMRLRGAGEVTRVQGDQVLSWKIEPGASAGEQILTVQLNQAQKDHFSLQVQMQTSLGAFPQSMEVVELRPEGATRFSGHFRIVNDGAVRLEVAQANGLSQISPDQFPESDATKATFRLTGSQRFVYRFSSPQFGLRIQADQILPELTVSELLEYRLGETDSAIDAEIEIEIREAPLRELLVRVPRGYPIAKLNAAGLSDYFVRETEDQPDAELRLVYAQPVSGRQVVQLRLERNKPLSATTWPLPKLEVLKAKSVRGHIAVTADAGLRLTPERTQGLTEIATAFYPRKVAGIQTAFRISDANWQAAVKVERLPQTVQADVFHLFSIGEGVAYGSSVMNYVVSGAPISVFRVELSDEYFNVEFSGKDVRNWQKTNGGYVVQLHTPVSGAYTLLATYERPFKSQGETLGFTGARPLAAQTEQGYTLVVSAYQFQVKPVEVSTGLVPLETGEVPPEYRLFFDAPILAAYRYNARPFNLRLALSPLAQGDSVNQVVDRVSLQTRISKQGQVVTDANYFVKNRGNPHFRLTLPSGMELWSATVNSNAVVPVKDGTGNLIPLPQHADPNAPLAIALKVAMRSSGSERILVSAPVVGAPVMLAEWRVEADTGQRLKFSRGSLTPAGPTRSVTGLEQLSRMLTGDDKALVLAYSFGLLALFGAVVVMWRWAVQSGTYRFSARHVVGTLLGVAALALALVALAQLAGIANHHRGQAPTDLLFLAPVQQTGSALTIEVRNLPDHLTFGEFLGYAWPAILALGLWVYAALSAPSLRSKLCQAGGWTVAGWMALRLPNGLPVFLGVVLLFLFIQVVVPGLRRIFRVPQGVEPEPPPIAGGPASAATTALIIGGLLGFGFAAPGHAAVSGGSRKVDKLPAATRPILLTRTNAELAQTVVQQVRVEEGYAVASVAVHWEADKGEMLPILFEPGVLTSIRYPSNSLRLVQLPADGKRAQQLLAEKAGTYDIEFQYQAPVANREGQTGFGSPVQHGLVNRANVTVINENVDVLSPQAVSVTRQSSGSNTVAELVLTPVNQAWIAWKPRSRDVKQEKPVYFVELSQLYIPTAGVVEGAHYVSVRPAQGELSELIIDIPPGLTITDVSDPGSVLGGVSLQNQAAAPAPVVSLWRFDPDTRKLRVSLNPAQSRPFAILIRSQVATGPLPFEKQVGLVSVEGAARQVGLTGFATGNEVQLDAVQAEGMSPINLEDFSGEVTAFMQARVHGLTVRRAYRYEDSRNVAVIKASAVEPDVRVDTQDTLSLGEDRVVLAANATVSVARAGIFRLSFVMPAGFDVESISGAALSHWTEQKTEADRVITLHLKGKTEGQQQFTITLAGPGVKATNSWTVPQVVFREAGKQRGTFLVVPEQGFRLQVASNDGVTQLDPQKSGIRQKGVLAFRVLQVPWALAVNVERVDAWVQVTGLQHASVTDAQVKMLANLQYQIENTGLKSVRLLVPTNAENVRFTGDQVADFLPVTGVITNGMQLWEVRLHRRIIGPWFLQLAFQTTVPDRAAEVVVRGVQAADVNLQRGFVTVQSSGRLQVRVENPPEALQPAEWQSIPRALLQDLQNASANYAFRLVEPSFQLPVRLERHEAVKLLPARVNGITFTSVISDEGVMLTQSRLEMIPGDKRLLRLRLPKASRFWFAFVNQNGVWPWREQDQILIPLEQQSRGARPITVEIFYSSTIGEPGRGSLDLELLAPRFDLPLENIVWRVSLSDKWDLKKWSGSLQLQRDELVARTPSLQSYLLTEATNQQQRTKEAENLLAFGNNALQSGDPQEARRAFQAAYGLSTHDAAFNEDARVQLHNIKLQQALIGLNVRQAATAGDTGALGGKFRELRQQKEINYTQKDAKEILDRNTADDNAALMHLAERIIQQQDAAVSSPAAIRANVPEQSRTLVFRRSVAVDTEADLKVRLEIGSAQTVSWGTKLLILAGIFGLVAAAIGASAIFRQKSA
jgi:hypothetical protein